MTMRTEGIKTYKELSRLTTFKERYDYLRIKQSVGKDTFGFDRYLNQNFYRSKEWKQVRDFVITRDNACDMGLADFGIYGKIIVHHMNPLIPEDIKESTYFLLNPDYLICVSHMTHEAIHYGDDGLLPKDPVVRTRNDTCPWKK